MFKIKSPQAIPQELSLDLWVGPSDPIRMDTYRVALGISMLCYFGYWWLSAQEWMTTLGFHVSAKAFKSVYVMPAMPPEWLPVFGILFFGSLVLWILGWKTRWTCPIVFVGVVYMNYVDILAAYTLNKMFVVSMAIFLCVPHGYLWSIEKKKQIPKVSVWPVRILQMTLVIHYFFAGMSKVKGGDWLQDPYVLWSQIQGLYRTPIASWMLNTFPRSAWAWMQYAALLFELLSPVLFLSKRLRPIGMIWGALFQTLVALTMHMLFFFSFQMLCLYIFFIDEKLLHRIRRGCRP
jgi:hypothetical protein